MAHKKPTWAFFAAALPLMGMAHQAVSNMSQVPTLPGKKSDVLHRLFGTAIGSGRFDNGAPWQERLADLILDGCATRTCALPDASKSCEITEFFEKHHESSMYAVRNMALELAHEYLRISTKKKSGGSVVLTSSIGHADLPGTVLAPTNSCTEAGICRRGLDEVAGIIVLAGNVKDAFFFGDPRPGAAISPLPTWFGTDLPWMCHLEPGEVALFPPGLRRHSLPNLQSTARVYITFTAAWSTDGTAVANDLGLPIEFEWSVPVFELQRGLDEICGNRVQGTALRDWIVGLTDSEPSFSRSNRGGHQTRTDLFERDTTTMPMDAAAGLAALRRHVYSAAALYLGTPGSSAVGGRVASAAGEPIGTLVIEAVAWAGVSAPGCGGNTPHVHPNAALSGVVYLSDVDEPLVLLDPRDHSGSSAWTSSQHPHNHHIKPEVGKTILFPAWLEHWVPAPPTSRQGSNILRVVVAFNVRFAHTTAEGRFRTLGPAEHVN